MEPENCHSSADANSTTHDSVARAGKRKQAEPISGSSSAGFGEIVVAQSEEQKKLTEHRCKIAESEAKSTLNNTIKELIDTYEKTCETKDTGDAFARAMKKRRLVQLQASITAMLNEQADAERASGGGLFDWAGSDDDGC